MFVLSHLRRDRQPSHFNLPVEIEGLDNTIGFTQWANNPASKNADVRLDPLLLNTSILMLSISL